MEGVEINEDDSGYDSFEKELKEKRSNNFRDILENNDDVYDEINQMLPYDKIKNDPERVKFLNDFRRDFDRHEKEKIAKHHAKIARYAQHKKRMSLMRRKKSQLKEARQMKHHHNQDDNENESDNSSSVSDSQS